MGTKLGLFRLYNQRPTFDLRRPTVQAVLVRTAALAAREAAAGWHVACWANSAIRPQANACTNTSRPGTTAYSSTARPWRLGLRRRPIKHQQTPRRPQHTRRGASRKITTCLLFPVVLQRSRKAQVRRQFCPVSCSRLSALAISRRLFPPLTFDTAAYAHASKGPVSPRAAARSSSLRVDPSAAIHRSSRLRIFLGSGAFFLGFAFFLGGGARFAPPATAKRLKRN